MKKIVMLVLIYVLGGISGIVLQYQTSGAADRARIAAVEDELKARNDKLDRCTDALINGLRPNASPTTSPPATTGPK
jgi:hypothetical protein